MKVGDALGEVLTANHTGSSMRPGPIFILQKGTWEMLARIALILNRRKRHDEAGLIKIDKDKRNEKFYFILYSGD